MSQSFFPWGLSPSTSPVPVNYDLIIAKTYPRVAFSPTEQGGVYQEIIEVAGTWWLVTNATWDDSLLGWYQSGQCNPALPAYAWSYLPTGEAKRLIAQPAGSINVAVTWTATFETDPGQTVVEPLALTSNGQSALTVNAVYNGTTGTLLNALLLDINDIVSSSTSTLMQGIVNGVTVWEVDKTGKLVSGTVPSTAITGPQSYSTLTAGTGIASISAPPSATIGLSHQDYVDLPNVQTITGLKTLKSFVPLGLGGPGLAFLTGGGNNGDTFWSSGSQINSITPLVATAVATTSVIVRLAEANNTAVFWVYIDNGLTINNTFSPTPAFTIAPNGNVNIIGNLSTGGNMVVDGTLGVSGTTTMQGNTSILGDLTLGIPALKDLANTWFSGINGLGISEGGGSLTPVVIFDGKNFAEQITSNDGTVAITTSGPENQNYDLSIVKAGATGLTQAIGVQLQGTDVTSGYTLKLPNTLPGGSGAQWFVTAMCHGFGLMTSPIGFINMVGPTPSQQDGCGSNSNTRTLYTYASMVGGQTPQVHVSGSNVNVNAGDDGSIGASGIALTILAVRIA